MAGRLANLIHSRATLVGRTVSRLACVLLAVVGTLPILAALALRSRTVEDWITVQTRAVLHSELGIEASYTLEQNLWPLSLRLRDLRVPSNDGGADALGVDEIVVRPRLLSLLSGNLEVGAIEVVNPRARLVFEGGRIRNVDYRLPQSKRKSKPLSRAPFSTLTVRGAKAELRFGDVSASIGSTDVELVAGPELTFSATLQAGESRSTWVQAALGASATERQNLPYHYHEDVLCSLEARVRYGSGRLEVEHLALEGLVDPKGEPNTRPECGENAGDPEELVRLSVDDASLDLSDTSSPGAAGKLVARAPAWLANRFARMPRLLGSVELQASGRYVAQSRLPELSAQLEGRGLGLDKYHIAKHLSATVHTQGTHIVIPRLELGIADGKVVLHDSLIDPFAPGIPAQTRLTETRGMTFPGLMRDLGVTEHTIVAWNFGNTNVSRVHGTLYPLHLDAEIESHNNGFVVFDRGWDDPARRRMIAVPSATVRGKIGVRPNAFEFYDTTSSFGTSSVVSERVSIGFEDHIEVLVRGSSVVELSDIGPLVGIPISGRMALQARLDGVYADPLLVGSTSVKDFVFGGFPVGNIDRSLVRFRPLWLEFEDLVGSKGTSTLHVPRARLDFETDASVAVDAHLRSNALDIRDFFAMWHLDEDPRWNGIEAMSQVDARVRYTLGGRNDPCGTGRLEVEGKSSFTRVLLFGEHYDAGSTDLALDWNDMDAKAYGMSLALSGLTLRKGKGALLGSFSVSPGAKATGRAVATAVSLKDIDGLGMLRNVAEGRASGFLELSGTLDALEARATASISQLRVGSATLPPSELRVTLDPVPKAEKPTGVSRCGGPIYPPFDLARYEQDPVVGNFLISGQLFDGQVRFERLAITEQRDAHARGTVELHELDLGSFAEVFPTLRDSEAALKGSLTGRLAIKDFSPKTPTGAEVKAEIDALWLSRGTLRAELLTKSAEITLAGAVLRFPELTVGLSTPGEPATVFDVRGQLSELDSSPRVEATLELEPFEVSRLTRVFPQIERARGKVTGAVTALGPLTKVRYSGKFQLEAGEFVVKGAPWALTGVRLVVALDDDQLRVVDGRANLGDGTLSLAGSASLDGMSPKELRLELHARNVYAPLQPGIEGTLNADLVAAWQGASDDSGEAALPSITGRVDVLTLAYTRPVTMSVDIADLTRRGRRTEFESYDPSADRLRFDVQLFASRPFRISNNLLEAEFDIAPEGLQLQGTNQRVGLIGKLNVKPGGRLQLRSSEFEVQNGFVRFANSSRIEPLVDVTATTEYRRYSDSSDTAPDTAEAGGGAASATGGRWLITMHAHGDAEQLKVDLSSDPVLAQDDIFLLLTVGVTRTELDQSQSASVGESVALEALGHLSGADEAVSKAIPVIDEFRFGSAYSSRAGRTEPTVTIGKRLAERIRASVTTGVAESREVRSKLEWRLSQRLSLEGTYDNVNDISSSALGNLGGDLRWRLEFE